MIRPSPPGRGAVLAIGAAAIAAAGVSTSNNMFLLVAATVLGAVVVAKGRGLAAFASLQADAFAEDLFAGQAGSVAIVLRSRRTPLRLALALEDGRAVPAIATPDGRTTTVAIIPRRRGRLALGRIVLSGSGPWGITTERRVLPLARDAVVYPAPREHFVLDDAIASVRGAANLGCLRSPGAGTEILGLRDHRPEDGVRRIHWRALAKTGRFVSKVYEDDDPGVVVLALDRSIPDETEASHRRFEDALSLLAAAIVQAHDRGLRFALQVPGHPLLVGQGRSHRNAALCAIADVEPLVGMPSPAPRGAIPFGAAAVP
ncbi:MAG: DUF58 domain-containing protein [Acidobacteriota bacterium]